MTKYYKSINAVLLSLTADRKEHKPPSMFFGCLPGMILTQGKHQSCSAEYQKVAPHTLDLPTFGGYNLDSVSIITVWKISNMH